MSRSFNAPFETSDELEFIRNLPRLWFSTYARLVLEGKRRYDMRVDVNAIKKEIRTLVGKYRELDGR